MTQYEMHAVEALGLLKFDFLGLSNLTILRQAVDLIRADAAIEIDLDHIPLDDAKTFELLASGETTGIFQLESAGMRRYIRELRPTSVYDLAAMVALYRPGPMDNIPAYIRRKHGQEQVTYLHPLLEPFLERDVRDLRLPGGHHGRRHRARRLHGARGGHARLCDPQEEVVGAPGPEGEVRHARRRSAAWRRRSIDAVFKAFEPFERYGFNKAHATCYGLIAYQTAYLKANYTVEYMTERADRVPGQRRRRSRPPSPSAAGWASRSGRRTSTRAGLEFTVEGEAIRFGLLAVKNVGEGRDRVDHRRSRGGWAVPFARRPVLAASTCAS